MLWQLSWGAWGSQVGPKCLLATACAISYGKTVKVGAHAALAEGAPIKP